MLSPYDGLYSAPPIQFSAPTTKIGAITSKRPRRRERRGAEIF